MTVQNALEDIANYLVKSIQDNMSTLGLNATGKTSKSISYEIDVDEAIVDIIAPEHILTLQNGAAPIKSKSGSGFRKDLEEWARVKLGMSPKEARNFYFAFLNTRKKKGYKVPNRYNKGGVLDVNIPEFLIENYINAILDESDI